MGRQSETGNGEGSNPNGLVVSLTAAPKSHSPALFLFPFSHLRHSRQVGLHDDLSADVRAEHDSLGRHEQVDGLEHVDEHLVLAVLELASLAPVNVARNLARDAGVVAGGTLGRLNKGRRRAGGQTNQRCAQIRRCTRARLKAGAPPTIRPYLNSLIQSRHRDSVCVHVFL